MHYIWGKQSASKARATILWRYYSVTNLLKVLRGGNLYFASAKEFEDQYEGSMRVVPSDLAGFPAGGTAEDLNSFFGNARHNYKVSCWHMAKNENALMWQAYAGSGKGAALCTTLDRLLYAIKPYRLGQGPLNDVFWCGQVQYLDLTKGKVPPNCAPPVGVVKRFFYKHNAFEAENEFRLLADLHYYAKALGDPAPPEKGILVNVDLFKLVDALLIGPDISPEDTLELKKAAASAVLSDRLRESSLHQRPRFL